MAMTSRTRAGFRTSRPLSPALSPSGGGEGDNSKPPRARGKAEEKAGFRTPAAKPPRPRAAGERGRGEGDRAYYSEQCPGPTNPWLS